MHRCWAIDSCTVFCMVYFQDEVKLGCTIHQVYNQLDVILMNVFVIDKMWFLLMRLLLIVF